MRTLYTMLGLVLIAVSVSMTGPTRKVIVLDVGHGGKDNGAMAEDVKEKEIALSIATKVKELIDNSQFEIVLTREDDQYKSLEERVKFINSKNPDYLISIHVDMDENKDESGIEFFINGSSDSKSLAEKLKSEFDTQHTTKGIEIANFYILKNTRCPATLIELGNLSNRQDRAYLLSPRGQEAMARAIIESLK